MQAYNPFSWFTSDMPSRFHSSSQMNERDHCEHKVIRPDVVSSARFAKNNKIKCYFEHKRYVNGVPKGVR